MAKLVHSFRVSPPPGSVPTISVPLTYFDIPWLPNPPVQRLFFYEFPHPTSHFIETALPMLKRSLSLTLQHFFPYAANIMCPQPPGKPYIHYMEANYPRPVNLLHPFVPQLPSEHVTVFPNFGICIGSTYCHAVGDGKSFMHLMRSWTSVYRSGGDLTCLENSLPFIKRDIIKDPGGIELVLLKDYWDWISTSGENSASTQDIAADKVRATFVLGRAHAEKLKHLVTAQCRSSVDTEQYHISTFVLYYFLCPYDCRNRLEFWVPTTYLGNCLKPCAIEIKKREVLGESGIILAAKAIGKGIKEMERSDKRIETMTRSFTAVAGSPKLQVYETNFGWGRPCKVELTHIDYDGAISLADCRDGESAVEVGVALNKNEMDEFLTNFEQTLKLL
ncbi:hypothetical protein ES332_A12G158200v1 [Gossypium tomentosum]|uniref:Anthocyanin acyltransferase n=1 Tax=Gossypium tomentosum TaxID=34277 RepID=A0A5D2N063_GOSTO|nr:hypothetical protein ES332_A12G158200v1 [Gossypium tomentosum]